VAGASEPVRCEFIAPLSGWEEWVAVRIEDFFPGFDVTYGENLVGKRGDGKLLANIRNTAFISEESMSRRKPIFSNELPMINPRAIFYDDRINIGKVRCRRRSR